MNPTADHSAGGGMQTAARLLERIREQEGPQPAEGESELLGCAFKVAALLPRNAADALIVLQAAYVLAKTLEAMGGL